MGTPTTKLDPELCNCLALRQAARHVTQFYDQYLVPTGLRTTQFSILAKLKRLGPSTINALAEGMVMDRTTLGRNIQPLEREGLIAVRQGRIDRRSKELQLTDAGAARLRLAFSAWTEAQTRFEIRIRRRTGVGPAGPPAYRCVKRFRTRRRHDGPDGRATAVMTTPDRLTPSKLLFLSTGMAGSFLVSLSAQFPSTNIADLQGGIFSTPDEASWILTAYIMASLVGIVTSGLLIKTLGIGRYLVISAVVFATTALACATAPELGMMIALRTMQGFSAGGFGPAAFVAVFMIAGGPRLPFSVTLLAFVLLFPARSDRSSPVLPKTALAGGPCSWSRPASAQCWRLPPDAGCRARIPTGRLSGRIGLRSSCCRSRSRH